MSVEDIPSEITCRPGTQDEWVWQSVLIDNEYGLTDQFDLSDTILDVGANVGAFAWACLERCAGRVICYEANLDNARQLTRNLRRWANRVAVHHLAVWRSDQLPGWLRVSEARITKGGDRETGGYTVVQDDGLETVGAIQLDEILEALGPVRLLKIDAEGSEYPILFTARRLDLVQEIVGEYHEEWPTHGLLSLVDGYRPTMACLKNHLESQGFTVTTSPGIARSLGIFRAVRSVG